MFGMLWIDVNDNEFQFLPISSNFATAIEKEWGQRSTGHLPDQLNKQIEETA
jgi:hypothetical protein